MIATTRHYTSQVLVIGAGVSGYCAAIQAGRLGCDTILVEKDAVLGGNAGPNLGVGITGADRYNPYGTETGLIHEIHEDAAWVQGFTQVSRGSMPYNISRRFEATVQEYLEAAGVRVLKRHYAREPLLRDDGVILGEDATETVLNETALDLPGIVESCGGDYVTGPNNTWGHGRLDILAAVNAGCPCESWLALDETLYNCNDTVDVTVRVTPINDNNPNAGVDFTANLAEESANGTAVGSISATDLDLPGDVLTYAITAGDPLSGFAIDASGNITIRRSSDSSAFETIDVNSVKVSGSGTDTITINPSGTFSQKTP